MNRLRAFAAMLSIASVLVAAIFLMVPSIGFGAVLALVVAAGCLAVVAPFEARDPPARKRVLVACIGYVVAGAASLALTIAADAGNRPAALLALLVAAGVVLAIWAFATRNRRRKAGWKDYYD